MAEREVPELCNCWGEDDDEGIQKSWEGGDADNAGAWNTTPRRKTTTSFIRSLNQQEGERRMMELMELKGGDEGIESGEVSCEMVQEGLSHVRSLLKKIV